MAFLLDTFMIRQINNRTLLSYHILNRRSQMKGQTLATPLVLVYFKVRGKLQPIRNLICFLDLPYIEVHLQNEEEKKRLPQEVKTLLRSMKIDISLLPLLAHQGFVIYELMPIMNYLCRRFNAQDLMGRNVRQRAKVNEIMEIMILKQPNLMGDIFKLAEQCVDKSQEEIKQEKMVLYEKILDQSGYIAETCHILENNSNGGGCFILGTITLIDFFFIETCHYLLGIFNSIHERKLCAFQNFFKGFFKCKQEAGKQQSIALKHFYTIQNYVNCIESQLFYKKYIDFLQSFTMICPHFSAQKVNGLKKIWGYNCNYIK